jgi:CheY-like chemotaxis protein
MPSTLLLADDSVTIQRVIELTFASEDVQVVATNDGEAAIRRIDADPPDIVLADIGMPLTDGYAVAAHVKNSPRLRHIPVLLLTGAFDPIDEERARTSRCDGFLVKPFEPQQLVGRVKELLVGQHAARSLPSPSGRSPAEGAQSSSSELHVVQTFQRKIEELDTAFAGLEPGPEQHVTMLDEEDSSDFARDLHLFGSGGNSAERTFGDWDLPGPPAAPVPAPPDPLNLRETLPVPGSSPAGGTAPRLSMAGAFSALLAAERAQPASARAERTPIAVSESTVEEIVRRVFARMTDDAVRRIVLETAERLIREELEKIGSGSE